MPKQLYTFGSLTIVDQRQFAIKNAFSDAEVVELARHHHRR
ncbi:MAG: hypothetical protein U0Z44_00335 [Kouleothrix sp.]